MSERVTIGGVAYEAIGSNSSNLLLKCNGTASWLRISGALRSHDQEGLVMSIKANI